MMFREKLGMGINMKIEINKRTTMEGLELDVLTAKDEIYRLWEMYADMAKQLKDLREKLELKGML
ncbi:MAG TPA: hypothetical protein VHP38_00830 [Ruminiclostridium sp.]|nr:hypothetical protein [Ruminiclostridium sp.]